jgi:arylsulfatase A-like enzyme
MQHKQDSQHVFARRQLIKYGLYGGAAAVLPGGLLVNGCSGRKTNKRPNVLLISLDTVRRDHCSVYGYEHNTTPNLIKLAKQGALFDLAYSPASTTSPSHATMFTSLYPVTHGVVKNGLEFSDKYETLAEILKGQGYQTASFVSSFVLHSKFGFAQGFDFFDDEFLPQECKTYVTEWEGITINDSFDRRAPYTTARAINWLKNKRDSSMPFFMFVHYFDPHNPYLPPEPFRSFFAPRNVSASFVDIAKGLYDAEIAFTDKYCNDLIEQIGLMGLKDDTLIVIVSDHGEGLMQHGYMFHGVHIYEEYVRVPMIFIFPGRIKNGAVFKQPVELVDLVPTILDLLDIKEQKSAFQGQNLAPTLLTGAGLDMDRPIYLHRRHYVEKWMDKIWVKGEKFGVRIGKWKYIVGDEEGTKELFNLEADPGEKNNLYMDFKKVADSLSDELDRWKQSHMSSSKNAPRIPEDDLKKLKTLGYVE